MEKVNQYSLFFLLALLGHLSILGLFAINYTDAEEPNRKPKQETPEIIQASILDETRVTQKAKELKQAAETKQRLQKRQKDQLAEQIKQEKLRLKTAKNQRKQAEAKAKKDQKIELDRLAKIRKNVALEKQREDKIKKNRLAEEQRVKAQQQKTAAIKKEKLRKQAAAEEKKRLAKAKQLKQQKIATEKKQAAKVEKLRLQKIADEKQKVANAKRAREREILRAKNAKIARIATVNASVLIDKKVTQSWNRPNSISGQLACSIRVGLLPTGDVMSVSIEKSSGNAVFDASAERAVYKASPFPLPNDSAVFERNFRNFKFNFSPK